MDIEATGAISGVLPLISFPSLTEVLEDSTAEEGRLMPALVGRLVPAVPGLLVGSADGGRADNGILGVE